MQLNKETKPKLLFLVAGQNVLFPNYLKWIEKTFFFFLKFYFFDLNNVIFKFMHFLSKFLLDSVLR